VKSFSDEQTMEQMENEMKLTMLLTWEEPGSRAVGSPPFTVYSHVAALPPRPAPPIKVEVKGAPRLNAKAKDSEWVRERQALESSMGAGVNEIVLMDSDGGLPEGTQTNFFALQGGTLVTAGDGVLEGTVRKLVLQVRMCARVAAGFLVSHALPVQVCEEHSIPVRLETPNVRDIGTWEGAFISSTSRLLLPVDHIAVYPPEGAAADAVPMAGAAVAEYSFPSLASQTAVVNEQLARRIERLVMGEVLNNSERVL
jgi:thiol oxidase